MLVIVGHSEPVRPVSPGAEPDNGPLRGQQCQVDTGRFVAHTVPLPRKAESAATRLRWRQELLVGGLPELRATWAIDDIYIERLTVRPGRRARLDGA